MCDMTDSCECTEVEQAYTGKDVEFYNPATDQEFYADGRITVDVCQGCGVPDWRTIC